MTCLEVQDDPTENVSEGKSARKRGKGILIMGMAILHKACPALSICQ